MSTPPPVKFNPNAPVPTDSIAAAQPIFQKNFETLYNAFAANHIPLDALSGAGNHNIIQLFKQDNQLQADVGEILVYTRYVHNQIEQVFIKFPGQDEIQLTNYQLYTLSNTDPVRNWFTFLPGKILIYFGLITTSVPGLDFGKALLNLQPAVAKHIIGMSFCPLGATPLLKPYVTLQPEQNGFIKGINVMNASGTGSVTYYYCVLANL